MNTKFERRFNENLGSFEWHSSEAMKDATVQCLEEIQKEPAGSFY